MKHDLRDSPTGRKVLSITAEWSEVAADYDDLLAEYRRAQVPGFRAGKAPSQIIEKRYRKEIRGDLTARCGQRLARQALRERDLHAAGPMAVTEITFEPGRAFSLRAECIPLPRLDLPDYTGAPLVRQTDDERRDELTAWLLERTIWEPPDALVREECGRSAPGTDVGSDEWKAAAVRVKLMVILEQIAETEGIEVDERDVDARIAKVAAESALPPAALRRQLGREGVSRLQSLLRAEQTLTYLLGNASTDDVPRVDRKA